MAAANDRAALHARCPQSNVSQHQYFGHCFDVGIFCACYDCYKPGIHIIADSDRSSQQRVIVAAGLPALKMPWDCNEHLSAMVCQLVERATCLAALKMLYQGIDGGTLSPLKP